MSIVQNIPKHLIDHDTLPKVRHLLLVVVNTELIGPQMCHLLLDPSAAVQKMAYSLLQQAAKRRTEYLVVEAGVDTSGETTFQLPTELLDVLSRALEGHDESQAEYVRHISCIITRSLAQDVDAESIWLHVRLDDNI